MRHPFFEISKKLYKFGEKIGKKVLVIAYKDRSNIETSKCLCFTLEYQ